jgi:hypothetical protein
MAIIGRRHSLLVAEGDKNEGGRRGLYCSLGMFSSRARLAVGCAVVMVVGLVAPALAAPAAATRQFIITDFAPIVGEGDKPDCPEGLALRPQGSISNTRRSQLRNASASVAKRTIRN